MLYPDKKHYLKLAAAYDIVPVCREVLADLDTPVSVLQRFASRENVFLLESMEGGEKWGRYSFLGIDPELVLEADHSGGSTGELEKLRRIYKGIKVAPVDGLPRFIGGAVGFFGYEAVCEFEKMPPPSNCAANAMPRSRFLKAGKLIVFDNVRHTVRIVISTDTRSDAHEKLYDNALESIEKISAILKSTPPSCPPPSKRPVIFSSNMTRDDFVKSVMKAKKYIFDGDIIQAVLSQKFSAECPASPLQIYRALRFLNPSPYTFFLKIGEQHLVGSSPEVMVRLTGDRVELRPIAGTRPRGGTEQEDRKLADELLADEKEKAEHVMLVDLGRNDVGRIAESGSVQVTEYMVIERYSHVMHMVSHVEGTLRKEFDAYDVVKASFPAGTLTGAPKIRAMEIIHELEPGARGPYGGAVGYIGYDGNMDLAITIRTVEITGGRCYIQAGAGIVFDSDPVREFDETCHKARGMQKAVEMAAGGLEVGGKGQSA